MLSLKKIGFAIVLTGFTILIISFGNQKSEGPSMATGIKIGEVTSHSAIVWTRLTKNQERINNGPMPIILYKNDKDGKWSEGEGRADREPKVEFPVGSTIANIDGAVPGEHGEARLLYKLKKSQDWITTKWEAVKPEADFTLQFKIKDLKPAETYEIEVQSRSLKGKEPSCTIKGSFRTASLPETPQPVSFTVVTGTAYPDRDSANFGYKIYPQMLKLHPDFFVHTGDIVYYDRQAKTSALARWHWDQMYSLPSNVEFHRQVASYFIKDDHDTWMNDCYPTMQTRFMGEFTFKQGQEIFLQEAPMGEKTFRTIRWGKDLQIWLPEGRDFRSSNDDPDGPEKTIWGKEQMEWFMSTVKESDATFKVLISPTPIIGPDRGNKNDNHANAGFRYEQQVILKFIASQKNMFIVCGDRHWQYVSKDPATRILEFSCGPASNEHAGGWNPNDREPQHLYLNVIGGFLYVKVNRVADIPEIIFSHFGVTGKLLNEYKIPSQK
ncbi:MAG: alkaline phosphatase D family protein [Bacteroidia bacterium]|nr:alkaline phosphatase D family protein [Bacteroidia bacterium]